MPAVTVSAAAPDFDAVWFTVTAADPEPGLTAIETPLPTSNTEMLSPPPLPLIVTALVRESGARRTRRASVWALPWTVRVEMLSKVVRRAIGWAAAPGAVTVSGAKPPGVPPGPERELTQRVLPVTANPVGAVTPLTPRPSRATWAKRKRSARLFSAKTATPPACGPAANRKRPSVLSASAATPVRPVTPPTPWRKVVSTLRAVNPAFQRRTVTLPSAPARNTRLPLARTAVAFGNPDAAASVEVSSLLKTVRNPPPAA